MLIVYRKTTGEVVENQGIISMFPLGTPDTADVIQNVIERFGGNESDYDIFRLHDVEDKEIVMKTFTHDCMIRGDQLVFGEEKKKEEITTEPSQTDLLAEELVKMKFDNMQKDNVISSFGEEITKLKFELMALKGGL